MKKLVVILLLSAVIIAQDKYSVAKEEYKFAPRFYVDLLNKKGESLDKNIVDIYVKIPYSNLQFVKTGEKYEAGYSANVLLYNESGKRLINSISWEEKLSIDDFNSSISASSFSISFKQMEVEPDKYLVKFVVEDFESKKMFYVDVNFNAKQFKEQLDLSDILLIEREIKSKARTQLVPNIQRLLASDTKSLAYYYEVYSDDTSTVTAEYNIYDRQDTQVYSARHEKELVPGTNKFPAKIDSLIFGLGNYKLVVNLFDEKNEQVSRSVKVFYSKLIGFPTSITDLTEAIEQTRYIADPSELSEMEDAESFDEKLKKFTQFWKTKDPDPSTETNEILHEYYRRVNYANRKFDNVREGWRSDMGMIYIILGPPDSIERHPFESNSKPYEIWSYHKINRSFVFVDYTGFGDYRLLNRNYRDWSTFRY